KLFNIDRYFLRVQPILVLIATISLFSFVQPLKCYAGYKSELSSDIKVIECFEGSEYCYMAIPEGLFVQKTCDKFHNMCQSGDLCNGSDNPADYKGN
ncbi:hypothetical protein PENTCL1PPCAC_5116, partial [Pristionchus entomophagus]